MTTQLAGDSEDCIITVVVKKNGCSVVYDINKNDVTVGRGSSCDIAVENNVYLSKHHCTLHVDEARNEVSLEVLSSNGLLINRTKYKKAQITKLNPIDVVHVVHRKDEPDNDVSFTYKLHNSGKATKEEGEATDSTLEYDIDVEYVSEEKVEKKSHKRPPSCNRTEEPAAKSSRHNSDCAPNDDDDDAVLKKDKKFEENLICPICQDIYHECVSCQPCMHSFCGGCYVDWKYQSQSCPTCRKNIKSVGRNHTLNNLALAYLEMHPEKRRSKEEIEELDKKCKDDTNGTRPTRTLPYSTTLYSSASSYNTSDDPSDDDSDDDYDRSSPQYVINTPRCRECPVQGASNTTAPTTSRTCEPGASHLMCSCCRESFPGSDDDTNNQCSRCYLLYCHYYWGCRKDGCLGCLNRFKDLRFDDTAISGLINNNPFESEILQNYLTQKSINISSLHSVCVSKIQEGLYKIAENNCFTADDVMCHRCGLLYLRELAHQYRRDIPLTELADDITSREDCHWGRNCRTQQHSARHARRFNHICEQTRFR